ncbi:MAG: hypothetical protein ACPGQL_04605 [Thermoplasmatota archaeon]
MAESKREEIAPDTVNIDADEEAQKRRDRITMIIFFAGLLGAVGLMVLIAKFLSGS